MLNQDNAKTFLADSNPGKLYDFFMRATLLDDCKREYTAAVEQKAVAETMLGEKEGHLPYLEGQVKKWEFKLDQIQNMKDREKKIDEKKNELLWALEAKSQEYLKTALQEREKWTKKMEVCQRHIEEQLQAKEDLDLKKAEAQREIQEIAAKAQKEQDAVNELKETYNKCFDVQKQARRAFNAVRNDHDQTEETVRQLESRIDQLRSGGTTEYERKERERTDKVERLREQVREHEQQLKAHQVHHMNLKKNLDKVREDLQGMMGRKTSLEDQVRAKKRQLENLQTSQDNKCAVYGEGMQRLLKLMKAKKDSFKHFPLGPIGAVVNLKSNTKLKQALVIEIAIGRLLSAFIVDNCQDGKMLDFLQKQCRTSFAIITMPYSSEPFDISRGRCYHREYPTIVDLLEVKNPTVFNCLMDQRNIDQILVIPTGRQAQELLSAVENVPANCDRALTEDMFQFFPAPNYRSYPIWNRDNNCRVLTLSVTEVMAELEKEVKEVDIRTSTF